MKQNTFNLIIAIILLAIPFGYAFNVYPSLPNSIPIHFNIKGEADRFGGKGSIFIGPSILAAVGLFVYFILTNLKHLDPKRYKAADDDLYKKMALFMVAFLSIIGSIIIYSATNNSINITKLLLPFLGFGFAAMGWYMPRLHQNYFAGFKLPWTLENEHNWNETHKIAGKIWLYGGIIQAVGAILLPIAAAFILFIIAVVVMVIIPTVFSYQMFKNGNELKA